MNDKELNKALEQLAEDVPPMPADFHGRWMNAVRAEAEKDAPAAGKETRDKTASLVRWTRMLSVAAVFVFLIGGTILYRNSRKSLSAPVAAVENAALPEAAEPAEEKAEAKDEPAAEEAAEAAVPEAAAEEPEADMAVYEAYEAHEAEEAPVMMAAVPEAPAAEEADLAAEAEETDRTNSKSASAANAYAGEAPVLAAGKAAETADEAAPVWEDAEAEYEEEAAYEEAAPVPTEAPTEVPTAVPTAAPTEAPDPEPTAEPSGQEKTGFLSEAGAFFSDMGDFLLAALPYLLVLAVPAAAAVIIRRRNKARESGRHQ